MKTRITLTLDEELLQAARAVAAEEGRPLSALLTDQLAAVARERKGSRRLENVRSRGSDEGIDPGWTPGRSRYDVHER